MKRVFLNLFFLFLCMVIFMPQISGASEVKADCVIVGNGSGTIN